MDRGVEVVVVAAASSFVGEMSMDGHSSEVVVVVADDDVDRWRSYRATMTT